MVANRDCERPTADRVGSFTSGHVATAHEGYESNKVAGAGRVSVGPATNNDEEPPAKGCCRSAGAGGKNLRLERSAGIARAAPH